MRKKSWKIISSVLAAVMLISTVNPVPVSAALEYDSTKHVSTSAGDVSPGDVSSGDSMEPLRIEAESCSELEGAIIEGGGEESGQRFGGVKNGGYAKYDNIDFGTSGFASAVFRASAYDTGADRRAEIRIDSKDGQVIGICEMKGTGDWNNFRDFSCGLFGNVTGKHDVYILFKGGGTLYNLNWFEFHRSAAAVSEGDATAVTAVALPDKVLTGTVVQPTITPAEATVYYGWYVDGVLTGTQSTYNPNLQDVGKKLQLQVVGYGAYAGKAVSGEKIVTANDYSELDFDAIAYQAFTSFINKYYTVSKGEGKIGANYFWDFAEMYEIVIDAYERTGEERYKNMIDEIFQGFTGRFGTDWSWNDYNDDIMWMVIASARAYEATGKQAYLDAAKTNFDMVYDNYVDDKLGDGTGMWWKKEMKSKNACVNGPASIAASLLAEATGDATYYDKAKTCLDWVVNNLYADGKILDNMGYDGKIETWNFTYNQATFVGAATLLAAHYKDTNDATNAATYLNYAKKAVDYTIYTKYNAGVMNDENGSQDIEDCHGFKGILPRWFYLYAMESNSSYVMDWMRLNAATAWGNRNSDGIIWTTWGTKTENDKDYYSFGASTAVAMLQNIISSDDIVKEGLNGIQAEDFNSCRGVVLSDDKNRVSSVKNGYYTIYRNVDFGNNGAIRAVFNAGAVANGGTIEIHLDNAKGTLLGTANITNTGSYSTLKEFVCEITRTTGMHDVCLLYKGTSDFLFEVDNFSFSEDVLTVTDTTVAGKSAYDRIEAEECDDISNGLGVNESNDEGGKVLCGINTDGCYSVYKNVEFGATGADSVVFRASSWSGGTIEIHEGAVDGNLIGTCVIPANNSWTKFKTYTARLETSVTGEKDLYLVYKGSYMFNIDWFRFFEAGKTSVTGVQINGDAIGIGTKLKADIVPANATVHYEWYAGKDNSYELVGTKSTYTTTSDDLDKTIRLRVTGTGNYGGCVESNETSQIRKEVLDAYTRIEAEAYVEGDGFGADGENSSDVGGGKHLGGVQANGWAKYTVNFGNKAPVKAALRASSENGGTISVYLDEKGNDNKLIGTFIIPAGKGWFVFQTYNCDISAESVTGVHDVYLVFNGDKDMYNVNWFRFYNTETEALTGATIPADAAVGNTLRATVTPADATYSCKWFVSGVEAGTGDTYTIGFDDAGKKIKVEITGTGLYTGTVTSNETNEIPAVTATDAYTTVLAESAVSFTLRDDGTKLGNAPNNSYALYTLDFGSQSPATITVNAGVNRTGTVKVYLDEKDKDENLIGTCQLETAGGWNSYRDYVGVITKSGITGKHFVYLVFTADGDSICNFEYFKFTAASAVKTDVTGVSIPSDVYVGDTLNATTNPAGATVSYKWTVDGTEAGTGSTYTVKYADLGKKIQVEVTGQGNYQGTVTSTQTNEVKVNYVGAYENIESESFLEAEGGYRKDATQIWISGESWYTYAVDFGTSNPASVAFRAATAGNGGTLSVYLDSRSNLIGSGVLGAAEGQDYANWVEYQGAVNGDGITGKHVVYLKFEGNGQCNFDWFKFTAKAASQTPVSSVSVTAEDVYVGDTLSATVAPEGATVSYKWTVDGTEAGTGSTYTVKYADLGKKIQVEVTGMGNYTGTATSTQTKEVKVNYVGAYENIESESFLEAEGGYRKDATQIWISGESWYTYAVDFGTSNPASVAFRAATAGNGGTLSVYLDSRSNLIGSGVLGAAEGQDYANWVEYQGAVNGDGITGKHVVYLKFEGNGQCNFDWFKFTESETPVITVPVIATQPVDAIVTEGAKATFTVEASGTDVSYQWMIDRKDGNGWVALSGATAASYTTGVTTLDCSGFQYKCVVSNTAGNVTSSVVTLTVNENPPASVTPAITYKVVVEKAGNGTVTASKSTAEAGESITLTAKADNGYTFKTWEVVDGTLNLAEPTEASVTFTMPSEDVTVKAVFEKKSSYVILNGENQEVKEDKNDEIQPIRVDGETEDFLEVRWNGRKLTRDVDYTVKRGSTIITFTEAFLASIPVGEHRIEIEFTNGIAETLLTVADVSASGSTEGGNNGGNNNTNTNNGSNTNNSNNSNNSNNAGADNNTSEVKSPNTGDGNLILLWVAVAVLGSVGAVFFGRKKDAFEE